MTRDDMVQRVRAGERSNRHPAFRAIPMFSTIWSGFFGLDPEFQRAGRLLVPSWIEAALTAIVVERPGAAPAGAAALPSAAAPSAASVRMREILRMFSPFAWRALLPSMTPPAGVVFPEPETCRRADLGVRLALLEQE
jgi:hypothetical protein